MSEAVTKHILKKRAKLRADHFNGGRENGPWTVKKGSGLKRWEVHYESSSK